MADGAAAAPAPPVRSKPRPASKPASTKKYGGNDRPQFIHEIDYKQAEQLLLNTGIDGSFLVRTSSNDPLKYSLSFRYVNEVEHIKIVNDGETYTCDGIPDLEEFSSIAEFVMYCQTTVISYSIKTRRDPIELKLDYPLWPTDYAPKTIDRRIFYGKLVEAHAKEILNQHDESEGNCLVHSSTCRPGFYVITVRIKEQTFEHLLVGQCSKGLYLELRDGTKIEYPDMQTLIRHYNTTPIVVLDKGDKKGKKTIDIYLTQAIVCPWNNTTEATPIKSASALPADQLAEQFKTLQCMTSNKTSEFGKLPENLPKNRYRNILPYDETRVELTGSNWTDTDYINANRLKFTDPNFTTYVGTQGPLPVTALAFWWMIWQESCSFIVMLTKVVEGGKTKCHAYWPHKKNEILFFDNLVLTCKKVTVTKDYTITTIQMDNGFYGDSRTIYHYHYTAWPDKSVPSDIKTLVSFTEEILRHKGKLSLPGPIAAHCSAGIGRTGAYVILSIIIEHVQRFERMPDILELCKLMRDQRQGMVQTLPQYELIHNAANFYWSNSRQTEAVIQYGNVSLTPENVLYGNCSTNRAFQ